MDRGTFIPGDGLTIYNKANRTLKTKMFGLAGFTDRVQIAV